MFSQIQVRAAVISDSEQLSQLRKALWPSTSAEEHTKELTSLLAGNQDGTLPCTTFVAETTEGLLAGFLEVDLRSHADGCDPKQPVGYVEGWFVEERYRRTGVGARLLAAAESWARSQGCVEMASDTWIDNDVSQQAHQALGFEVVDRCVHYRKML